MVIVMAGEVIKDLLKKINKQEGEIKTLQQVSAVFANEIKALKNNSNNAKGYHIAPTEPAHNSTALERSRARKIPSHAPSNS